MDLPIITKLNVGATANVAAPRPSRKLLARATQMLMSVIDQPARFSSAVEIAGNAIKNARIFTADTTDSSVAT